MKVFYFLRQSIFSRILLIFLVTVIPVYFVGTQIYHWGIHSIQDQILDNFSLQLEREAEYLEAEFSKIMERQLKLTNSKEINWFLTTYPYSSPYDRGKNILDIQEELISIRESSFYVKSAYLVFPSLDIEISDQCAITHGYDNKQILSNLMPITGTKWLTVSDGLYLYSTIASNGEILYSVITEFSAELLNLEIQSVFSENNQTFFVDSSDLTPLWNNDEIAEDFGFVLQKSEQSLTRNESGYYQINAEWNGEKWIILYEYFDGYSLALCNIAPENVVYKNVRNYQLLFGFFQFLQYFWCFCLAY